MTISILFLVHKFLHLIYFPLLYNIHVLWYSQFRRATVHDPATGELVPAHYRISKSAWLKDEESAVVARVSRRVADITGLSMTTAEELQVVNYGIGGHYDPHFDFARVSIYI